MVWSVSVPTQLLAQNQFLVCIPLGGVLFQHLRNSLNLSLDSVFICVVTEGLMVLGVFHTQQILFGHCIKNNFISYVNSQINFKHECPFKEEKVMSK